MGSLFGQKLRYLRKRHHLTQRDLATSIHPGSQAHISNMEASRSTPSLEIIVAVANRLAIQVTYLVREDVPVQAADQMEYQRRSDAVPLGVAVFGLNLTRLRVQAGLTQARLAVQLALGGHAHSSLLENGHQLPSVELLLRVADRFGVTVDDLLTASG